MAKSLCAQLLTPCVCLCICVRVCTHLYVVCARARPSVCVWVCVSLCDV